jgi:hypothetical protein
MIIDGGNQSLSPLICMYAYVLRSCACLNFFFKCHAIKRTVYSTQESTLYDVVVKTCITNRKHSIMPDVCGSVRTYLVTASRSIELEQVKTRFCSPIHLLYQLVMFISNRIVRTKLNICTPVGVEHLLPNYQR